jgi:hypothetical protein
MLAKDDGGADSNANKVRSHFGHRDDTIRSQSQRRRLLQLYLPNRLTPPNSIAVSNVHAIYRSNHVHYEHRLRSQLSPDVSGRVWRSGDVAMSSPLTTQLPI